jgi:antitoxin component YwqK of YwqJK toxin-antitoxin module
MIFLFALLTSAATSAFTSDDKRCPNQLECELRCPEVSVQAQGKSAAGLEMAFCDPVGMRVIWLNDNRKSSQGERYGKQRTGPWRFWHANGKLKALRRFADSGAENGKQQRWFENGKKAAESNFDNGLKQGDFLEWHANGRKSSTRRFEQGSLVGTLQYWHANGRLAGRGEVSEKSIAWSRFYTSGKKGLVGSVEASGKRLHSQTETRPIGEWTLWFSNGRKQMQANFKGGALDGVYKRWFSSGKPLLEQSFYRGQPRGQRQTWHANGERSQKQNFAENGKAEGAFKSWYASGAAFESGNYRTGKRAGLWRTWHRNGELAETQNFKGGRVKSQTFDRYGVKTAEGERQNGRRIGTWTEYDGYQTKRNSGSYTAGVQTGLWRAWAADGKPLSKGHFDEFGRRVGAWRYDHVGGGKRFVVHAVKAQGNGRYLMAGRRLKACDKMAQNGACQGISRFDKSGRLRMRITLPSDWQQAAAKACSSKRKRSDAFCLDDHGDLLHAITGLARLVARRRLAQTAHCWSAGGEDEACPALTAELLPATGSGSVLKSAAVKADSPFAACQDQASCDALCAVWAQANDPFAVSSKAKRTATTLSCSPSGPKLSFHQTKIKLAASVGAMNLPHRQALRAEKQGPWQYFYGNGKLQSQGAYTKGFKQGEWLEFHQNGSKFNTAKFDGGLENGPYQAWHSNGQRAALGSFKSGVRKGDWSFYDQDGLAVSKGSFKRNKRHGRWFLFNDKGELESKGSYKDGRFVGRWLHYDSKGRKKGRCDWTRQGTRDHRVCKRNNNSLILRGASEAGLAQGPWVHYYRNSEKRMAGDMKNGERHGVWRFWHESGDKRAKGSYKLGQKIGSWHCWDDSGQRESCPAH